MIFWGEQITACVPCVIVVWVSCFIHRSLHFITQDHQRRVKVHVLALQEKSALVEEKAQLVCGGAADTTVAYLSAHACVRACACVYVCGWLFATFPHPATQHTYTYTYTNTHNPYSWSKWFR